MNQQHPIVIHAQHVSICQPAAMAMLEATTIEPFSPITTGHTKVFADGSEAAATDPRTDHVAVIDHSTGLMWAVESLGNSDDNDDSITQEQCIERCSSLRLLGFDDWRLPTRNELAALVDDTRHEPAIDTGLFPRVKPNWHWTSTPAAWSSASAWLVSFYDGGVDGIRRDLDGFALAVRRAGEFQGEVRLQELYQAWRRARRQKVPSFNQLRFDQEWASGLLQLQQRLTAGQWYPSPATCFVATRPKAREIHAPDFADRVVHHWLVPQLEAIWEPRFIHDSYANRKGRGSHAAVQRAQAFSRQVHSGQGGGWYLQLDIANFFNSIHRPTLWKMLRRVLQQCNAPLVTQQAAHALLRQGTQQTGVRYRATAAELALVPAHKRLSNAPTGRGLPIGNLSSQFFANVYLDALDQFVKHTLKAKRYLRYVDDFVLFHHDRAQLETWRGQIIRFLQETLGLQLKAEQPLRRLTDGLDFLGYVIFPTHTLARQRVVSHMQEALAQWQSQHVKAGEIRCSAGAVQELQHRMASFQGHLRHANTHRLIQRTHRRYPWLSAALKPRVSRLKPKTPIRIQ